MRFRTRALIVLAAAAMLVGAAASAEAQAKKRRAKQPALGAAVVHVLGADGQPVADAEVILVVERADGTTDRRLARTGVDGDATFVDVRADCRELRASVEIDGRTIEGQPRACVKGLEAFVVVPPIEPPPGRQHRRRTRMIPTR